MGSYLENLLQPADLIPLANRQLFPEISTGHAIDHIELFVLPHAIEDFAMDIWGDIEGVAFVDNGKCWHVDLVGMILGFSGRDI